MTCGAFKNEPFRYEISQIGFTQIYPHSMRDQNRIKIVACRVVNLLSMVQLDW